jgi:hypothetical protein
VVIETPFIVSAGSARRFLDLKHTKSIELLVFLEDPKFAPELASE